ncbi:MAG: DNA methyltransferase [Blastocatellia bacterium]
MKRDDKTEAMFKTSVPAMPEGYYSGDKPNPNLRAFVEEHLREHPYNPETDEYSVSAFDKPIETTKATAIYNMHTYWSKKPHDAIREYIRHYTKEGDLVLDPFCGSGGTALAALMEGRKAIAIDRSPAATFITKNYCTPVDVEELKAAFEELKRKVQPEIDWLYETRCDRCDGKATTGYTVYSQVFRCGRCMEKVTLFDCVEVEGQTAKGKPQKVNVCPHCYQRGNREVIRSQSEKFGSIPVMVSYLCKSGCKPARGLRKHNEVDEKKREYFHKYDLGKLREIERKGIPYRYPQGFDMTGFSRYQRDALRLYNIKEVADLFTKRNLWALAVVRNAVRNINDVDLRVLLTWCVLKCSRMMRFCSDGIGRIMTGTYYIPQIGRDSHVLSYINEAFGDVLAHHIAKRIEIANQPLEVFISTEDSRRLKAISDETVDYIFTDPPYADKIQYGELNFIWEAWLDFDTRWHDEEIIVNEVRGRSVADWAEMTRQVMTECYRVLKPGRWLSLCYHDTSEGTWSLVQDIMKSVGFEVQTGDSVLFIDTTQKTHNQIHADKVNKRDLVINFRKPRSGEAAPQISFTGEEDDATFNEKVRAIVSDYLVAHPGSTKDRIYDEVVSRMVRAGRMEPHNFDELLAQVADSVSETNRKNLFETADPDLFGAHQVTRWYLKEQGGSTEVSERLTEESAASRIEEFLVRESEKQFQKSQPRFDELNRRQGDINQALAALQSDDPERKQSKLKRELRETERQLHKFEADRAEWRQQALHYTYIQEFYFTINPRPQKTLFDLLEDYFCLTDEGNWRPPQTEEERERKAKERNQSIRHTIQRFCRLLSANEAIPVDVRPSSTTLAEWIKYCKNAQLYAQGKLLYEQGGLNLDDLSEDVLINVEEDYQVCARLLARSMGTEKKRNVRKGRGKKSEFQE